MAEPIPLKISARVARYVRQGVERSLKEEGLALATTFDPVDHLMLLFCLANDPDSEIKQTARRLFYQLPDDVIAGYFNSSGVHPGVRSLIERVHGGRTSLASFFATANSCVTPAEENPPEDLEPPATPDNMESLPADMDNDEQQLSESEEYDEGDEDGEIDPESEEFLSKYRLAQIMGIGEKIKMALTGDKEWRALLIKDANKLVSGSVVKNPRITDGEILNILKVGVQNDEIVRVICANKEWVKKYKIRKALVDCPKTPMANALRYMASLDVKDLAHYAKSKNINSVLSTQAKRLVLAKKK